MKSGWENDKWPPPPLFALSEMGFTSPSCKFHFQGNWHSSRAQMEDITGERHVLAGEFEIILTVHEEEEDKEDGRHSLQ